MRNPSTRSTTRSTPQSQSRRITDHRRSGSSTRRKELLRISLMASSKPERRIGTRSWSGCRSGTVRQTRPTRRILRSNQSLVHLLLLLSLLSLRSTIKPPHPTFPLRRSEESLRRSLSISSLLVQDPALDETPLRFPPPNPNPDILSLNPKSPPVKQISSLPLHLPVSSSLRQAKSVERRPHPRVRRVPKKSLRLEALRTSTSTLLLGRMETESLKPQPVAPQGNAQLDRIRTSNRRRRRNPTSTTRRRTDGRTPRSSRIKTLSPQQILLKLLAHPLSPPRRPRRGEERARTRWRSEVRGKDPTTRRTDPNLPPSSPESHP